MRTPGFWNTDHEPGGEVAETGTDGEHDIGLGGEAVGSFGADDADRSGVVRVIRWQRRLAGDRLYNGNPVALGERRQCVFGERVVHPSPGDDEGTLRVAEQCGGGGDLGDVRPWPGDLVDDRLEQAQRVVVVLRLHVLGQGNERRPAVGRVEHQGDRLGQRLDHLLGTGDPVPVAHDCTEGVVRRCRRAAEVLDLLQHGIGQAALERVPGEEQHRQAIGHRDAGGGHQVEGARTDRRRGDHELAPAHRLGVGDRRQRHPLLVLTSPRRQLVAGGVQGRAETGDVAVSEDGEHARDRAAPRGRRSWSAGR